MIRRVEGGSMRSSGARVGVVVPLASCSQSGAVRTGQSGNRPIPIAAANLKWPISIQLVPRSKAGDTVGGPCERYVRCILQASRWIHRTASHAHTSNEGRDRVGDLHSGTEGRPCSDSAGIVPDATGGTYRHTTSCDTTSDCVIFVEAMVRLTSLRPRARRTLVRSRPNCGEKKRRPASIVCHQ
jgi:hypothetical protein